MSVGWVRLGGKANSMCLRLPGEALLAGRSHRCDGTGLRVLRFAQASSELFSNEPAQRSAPRKYAHGGQSQRNPPADLLDAARTDRARHSTGGGRSRRPSAPGDR